MEECELRESGLFEEENQQDGGPPETPPLDIQRFLDSDDDEQNEDNVDGDDTEMENIDEVTIEKEQSGRRSGGVVEETSVSGGEEDGEGGQGGEGY